MNETSIAVRWKGPDDNEINGILTLYKAILHEQLADGNLRMVSKKTMSHVENSWRFDKLKIKTEYIIEVTAGTVEGFGPPSVIHQRTAGEGMQLFKNFTLKIEVKRYTKSRQGTMFFKI